MFIEGYNQRSLGIEGQQQPLFVVTSSRHKQELLQSLGIDSKVVPNIEPIDERAWTSSLQEGPLGENGHIGSIVQAIAMAKLEHNLSNGNKKRRLLATDTVKVTGDDILGKPTSTEEAVELICRQSGQSIKQVAGSVYWDGTQFYFGLTKILMPLGEISSNEARDYVNRHSDSCLRAAGAISMNGNPEEALGLYQGDSFPTEIRFFNNRGELMSFSSLEIGREDTKELVLAINGSHPVLLTQMGLL